MRVLLRTKKVTLGLILSLIFAPLACQVRESETTVNPADPTGPRLTAAVFAQSDKADDYALRIQWSPPAKATVIVERRLHDLASWESVGSYASVRDGEAIVPLSKPDRIYRFRLTEVTPSRIPYEHGWMEARVESDLDASTWKRFDVGFEQDWSDWKLPRVYMPKGTAVITGGKHRFETGEMRLAGPLLLELKNGIDADTLKQLPKGDDYFYALEELERAFALDFEFSLRADRAIGKLKMKLPPASKEKKPRRIEVKVVDAREFEFELDVKDGFAKDTGWVSLGGDVAVLHEGKLVPIEPYLGYYENEKGDSQLLLFTGELSSYGQFSRGRHDVFSSFQELEGYQKRAVPRNSAHAANWKRVQQFLSAAQERNRQFSKLGISIGINMETPYISKDTPNPFDFDRAQMELLEMFAKNQDELTSLMKQKGLKEIVFYNGENKSRGPEINETQKLEIPYGMDRSTEKSYGLAVEAIRVFARKAAK